MKKLLLAVLSALTLVGCVQSSNTDGAKFKEEYEALNGQEVKDNVYTELQIEQDNPMVYATLDEILALIEDGEGIIYFGFPECPWCRTAVPLLLDAAKELEVEKIYYYNVHEGRDSLELVDGEITVKKEKSEEYKAIYDALYDELSVYQGLEDESIKRLYFPTVYFMKDGKVIEKIEGTETVVPEFVDPFTPMNEEQKERMRTAYKDGIKKMRVSVCEEESKVC